LSFYTKSVDNQPSDFSFEELNRSALQQNGEKEMDERLEKLIANQKKRAALAEEMNIRRNDCVTWLKKQGFNELLDALRSAQEKVGEYKIVSQLFAAIFGGEFNGRVYDGLDNINFDELADAIQTSKEGHMSIRACIQASRWDDRLERGSSSGCSF
jgi:hypothetical protein